LPTSFKETKQGKIESIIWELDTESDDKSIVEHLSELLVIFKSTGSFFFVYFFVVKIGSLEETKEETETLLGFAEKGGLRRLIVLSSKSLRTEAHLKIVKIFNHLAKRNGVVSDSRASLLLLILFFI